jgi:hypothetical protein
MSEEDMDVLLQSFSLDEVPSLNEVKYRGGSEIWGFDGSYGWCCGV